MMGKNKKIISAFLIISSIGLSLVAGFFFGKFQVICPVCPPEDVDFSLFWETWETLKEKFVEPEKIDIQKMIYGAISGMVKSLEDPYTIFLTPDDTKKFEEDIKGIFEGVGIEIGIREGQLQVIAPLEGTPAQRAGLRPGDKIIGINDVLTIDMSVDQAVKLIRGPKDSKVILTIYRQEWGTTKDIEIIRASIEIPSLKWEIIDDNIVYFRLYHFTEKSAVDFREAAFEILASPGKKIILDLRNNPGGYLDIARDIAGWFLKKEEIVVIEDYGSDREKKEYKSKGPSLLLPYPTVILINQGSASGSEILAGALRDNRQILLIGEKSFGKGSIQTFKELGEGSSLKITIARWLTPAGKVLTDVGLAPDIEVKMTEDDYEQDRDPQLDKAIEIIREMR